MHAKISLTSKSNDDNDDDDDELYRILVKDLKLTPQQTQIIMALFKYVHDYLQGQLIRL